MNYDTADVRVEVEEICFKQNCAFFVVLRTSDENVPFIYEKMKEAKEVLFSKAINNHLVTS